MIRPRLAVPAATAATTAVLTCAGPASSRTREDRVVTRIDPAPSGTNHLAGQTSPYLLQHLHNPVDWYPWGPEAFAKARADGKPIFLSIGYAACHWCHVMERESFENAAIAGILNASFVAIKVDREERPDVDEIYMTAVHLMTGQGGWPLSVFLTPDGKPFFGGTYFPPEDGQGRRGFPAILALVRDAWAARRAEIESSASEIAARLRDASALPSGTGAVVGPAEEDRAASDLAARFDRRWGGFGGAPKFPPSGALALLLRVNARTGDASALAMATATLDRMAAGGMYDQIGGGFARYATDARWLVPHFEKMLYDQALLVPVYTDAWLVTRKPLYRRVVLETLDFVHRELTDPGGGFLASLDADSEGREGAFYVWTPDAIGTVLGAADGASFASTYGISREGNFEEASIPNLLGGDLAERAEEAGATEDAFVARLAPLRAKLLDARGRRPRPATDDKVLTAWNGLMITACARAYQAFGRPEDLLAARRAADFVLAHLERGGRLRASWRAGRAHLDAYLDDYAFLARGLVDLYEAAFDARDLEAAARLARAMAAHFGDGGGGFHFTADDHEPLLARTRSTADGALPAGAGVASEALLRLGILTGDRALLEEGRGPLAALRPLAERSPAAFASLLAAAGYAGDGVREIAVVGPKDDPATRALLAAVRSRYLPARAIAAYDPSSEPAPLPWLAGKGLADGRPAAYVCRGFVCDAPALTPEALAERLAR